MAKIIYGVAGQGFGHSTRSKETIRHLISQGHEVLVFTYGQGVFLLSEEFNVFEIPGLILSYKDNKLVYWDTIRKNIKHVLKKSRDWTTILKKFQEFNPDVVITDFEPLTALLAKIKRRPLISVDNQHQMTNTKIDISPEHAKDLLADKLIIKSMVWGAKYYLVTSFFETPIIRKNTSIFPPILRQEILNMKTRKDDYILVYQTSDFGHLVNVLKKINCHFVVFGMNVDKVEGNIEFKNYSSHEWLGYLANCRALIGNAGLSLITESIYLEKPYLAIPIKKQVEQIINAQYLQRKGFGLFTYEFSENDFKEFFSQLDKFDQKLADNKKHDNSAIFEKLNELIEHFSSKKKRWIG
ncbi:MAG: MJ1255/VC2487 family glycosyltransferase [Patescibacteria group bacterium]